ncbi:MAG TPA: penicillin-binding protein [Nitrospirae bacterium]|nr:stage V sporulation protein D [bacterium BMS3Abin10]GBE40019.1 stage V sporulation protein D [bacterium BMS3Bbin08]HDH51772.1 penicillin-binding protein [Nitrospirota bacterium]HDK17110.1 penicillin-binding protein [Nitrospirota bacterium]HDK41033.1 penicillin-binding protein [Nitrospirota bacterium]
MSVRRTRKSEKKLWDEDYTKTRLKRSKNRAVILSTIVFFCFSVICVRLSYLMVVDHEKLSQRAERQYRRTKVLRPQRGVIWDRNMRELAVNVETDSLYAVPSQVNDVDELSFLLAPLIKTSAGGLSGKISARKNKEFIWLARKMDRETSFRVNKLKSRLKLSELGVLTETKRYYPKGRIAAHILGHTNIDNEGLAGIELEYDSYMKGKAKKVQLGRDARGYSLSNGIEDNIQGYSLLLTIDEGIQHIVEREIDIAVQKWEAEAAVVIMMDPKSGRILAIANRPTYDPNLPGKVSAAGRRNRAITDMYEPGSTFKAILASAAIDEGVVKRGEKFDVSDGYIKVPGGVIRDVHRHGILDFREVIQKSSNVGAVQIGNKLGKELYYEYMRKFGFGEKTGIDLPGETRGLLRRPENWSGRSLASMSIGQEIGVTPLQLLRAYSAIANGGKLMRPYVVSEIISSEGEVIKRFSPKMERRVISRYCSAIMRGILKTVVEEGGTARRAFIKGNPVAGKTGTAQMVDPETGGYSKNDYVSSFVGFVPADDPELALIVVVYKPRGARYGGVVAAPVFRSIIEDTLVYLNIPMEREENSVLLVSKTR